MEFSWNVQNKQRIFGYKNSVYSTIYNTQSAPSKFRKCKWIDFCFSSRRGRRIHLYASSISIRRFWKNCTKTWREKKNKTGVLPIIHHRHLSVQKGQFYVSKRIEKRTKKCTVCTVCALYMSFWAKQKRMELHIDILVYFSLDFRSKPEVLKKFVQRFVIAIVWIKKTKFSDDIRRERMRAALWKKRHNI